MTEQIYKYPRTVHIEGSRFQSGDEDLAAIPFKVIAGRNLIIEEKLDGANTGISFTADGKLLLQSRGHYLLGGASEQHFNLFKQWAYTHTTLLWNILGYRYILYGEWLYAKHTIFYNYLPHYFLEFDLLDKEQGEFLSTERRKALLMRSPIASVPIIYSGQLTSAKQLAKFLARSAFIQPGHVEKLQTICEQRGLDVARAVKETDRSLDMEGLYIKVEEDGLVKERYKYVRASFLQAVENAEGHWLARPIIPNLLQPDIDLFGKDL
ncbi:MAG: RNA ligase family protein [Acidobacteriota bacterium]